MSVPNFRDCLFPIEWVHHGFVVRPATDIVELHDVGVEHRALVGAIEYTWGKELDAALGGEPPKVTLLDEIGFLCDWVERLPNRLVGLAPLTDRIRSSDRVGDRSFVLWADSLIEKRDLLLAEVDRLRGQVGLDGPLPADTDERYA